MGQARLEIQIFHDSKAFSLLGVTMQNLLLSFYPWSKALHVISMTAWMAGLFYLPRLFVYHVESGKKNNVVHETFCTMEKKLLRFIMNPAMISTWVFGIILSITPGIISWSQDIWIYPKLFSVFILTWVHHWLALRRLDFINGRNTVSSRTYRVMNEVPTICLVVIVLMVIVRPI